MRQEWMRQGRRGAEGGPARLAGAGEASAGMGPVEDRARRELAGCVR